MNWKRVLGAILLAVALALGAGVAYYTGVGPAPGGGDSGERLTAFPTATASGDSAVSGGTGSTATATSPPFSFTIDDLEDCGLSCRDVTVTLHNNQDEPAIGVTVFVRIFAGQDNTDTADLVWEGKEEIGSMEAHSSHTATKRVELSLQEAQQVERNGGWVTIVTTVRTDARTVTFRDSEQVA